MKHISGIISVIAISISFASCGEKKETKTETTHTQKETYKTMTLEQRQICGKVQLPGVMQPFQFVQLYPKISGFVKNVYVDRGSLVHRGQVLATLEAPETEQQVAAARQKYTQAEAVYITSKDRYRRLLETSRTPGTIAVYDLEAASAKMRADSATAQGEYANYKAQESVKSYLTITAPFDGIITERNIHPGTLAGPGSQNAKPMLVLQQLSKLRLVAELPEQYASQVKNGDKVNYRANALPGEEFSGLVSRSSQSLSSNFRSETVEIDVPNNDNKFKPGMYAEVVLPICGNVHAFVVPKSSVVTTTERKYVIAVHDNIAQWVDIAQGNQNNDSTEVFGDLKNGDMIVVNAGYQLKNGSRVGQ